MPRRTPKDFLNAVTDFLARVGTWALFIAIPVTFMGSMLALDSGKLLDLTFVVGSTVAVASLWAITHTLNRIHDALKVIANQGE